MRPTSRLSHEVLRDFFHGIHTMFKAGYPISDCVSLMAEEETDRRTKALFSAVGRELEDGISFSEALEHSLAFPQHTVALLKVGESVGKLEDSIASAAKYHEDRYRIAKQVRSALTYPAILVMLMLVVICVLLTKVIPVFDGVYASLGGSMTGAAGGILSFGKWLNEALPVFITVIICLAVAALAVYLIPPARRLVAKAFYHVAGDRGILLAINRANFASALSMAANSGTTFEDGIMFASEMLAGNKKVSARIKKCIAMLEEGIPLEDALKETSLLPASSCKLLKIGMQSGSGDVSMAEISERLTEEAEAKIADTVALIEPALVIITSLVTGAVLLTVMLPLINIMKVI